VAVVESAVQQVVLQPVSVALELVPLPVLAGPAGLEHQGALAFAVRAEYQDSLRKSSAWVKVGRLAVREVAW